MMKIIKIRDTKDYNVYKITGEGVAYFQKPLYLYKNSKNGKHKSFDCVPDVDEIINEE